MQLSNAINERLYPLITAEPYVLNRANGVLSCETATHIAGDDEDSNVIIQIYDNETIFVSFRRPDGNALVLGDNDYVDFSRQGAYDDQTRTYGECAFDADNVDFDQDPPEERCAEEGNFSIGSAAGEGDEYTHLAFKREYSKNGRREYNVNDIVIEIPDKSAGSIESREFLFVMRPLGQSGQKATIKFVTPQGEPIDFFGLETRPEFKIDCNKYITFRLQEITYGKFALLDWD